MEILSQGWKEDYYNKYYVIRPFTASHLLYSILSFHHHHHKDATNNQRPCNSHLRTHLEN
jgi:hypothetical protein